MNHLNECLQDTDERSFYICNVIVIWTLALLIPENSQADQVYKVDSEHTFVSFSYKHQGYSIQTSRFDSVTGNITLNDQNNAGVIDITIDTKSISTGSITFNKVIQADDLFATNQYPTASFKSEKIIFKNESISAVDGKLTIKSITKPIAITLTGFACSRSLINFKYICGANATTKLNRSDYNLGKYVPFVSDEVTIHIAIEATRE